MAVGGHANEIGGLRAFARPRWRPLKWWLYRGVGQPIDLDERDRRWPQPPPFHKFPSLVDLPAPSPDSVQTSRKLGAESLAHAPDPDTTQCCSDVLAVSESLIQVSGQTRRDA